MDNLSKALEIRDLNAFRQALEYLANPNEPDGNGITIYEKTLSSPGCAEFVKLCLAAGCNPNYVNSKKKGALNFATDSRDPENIRVVLEAQAKSEAARTQVDNKYKDFTPLNSLARNLNQANVDAVLECMRLLLENGASPNIPDDSDMTPLHHVLYNKKIPSQQKEKLINLLLEYPEINLTEVLREELKKWNPNLTLPSSNFHAINLDFDGILQVLRRGDEEEFITLITAYQGDHSEFIPECIMGGYHKAFDILISEQDFNINKKSSKFDRTYVEIAVVYGNWYALQKLLKHKDLLLDKDMQLLHMLVGRLDEQPSNGFGDYTQCFKLLLSCDQVDVNETDISDRRPLHYAIRYGHGTAVQELLRNGAYLGARSQFNELSIQDIDASLLEQHFDECITFNDRSRGSQSFEIIFNYGSLKLSENLKSRSQCNEMDPVVAMSNSKKLRHLLNHPLISNFITFKRNSISKLFYTYFFITLIFSIIFILNIFLMFRTDDLPELKYVFMILSWFSIGYFAVCELVKLIRTPLMSRPMSRILSITLIIIAVLCNTECSPDPEMYYSRVLAAFAILLLGIKLTVLIGSLPFKFLATHVLMLQEVLSTYLKSFLPYTCLVLSFALSFYLLDFYDLSTKGVFVAFLKTIVISTGEFNEGDHKYKAKFNETEDKNNEATQNNELIFAQIFFVIFVVFIAIVLINLLSALAIEDTQAIQSLAEVNSLIFAANLVKSCEVALGESWGCLDFLRLIKMKIPKIPDRVYIYPNMEKDENIPEHFPGLEMEALVSDKASKQYHKVSVPIERAVAKPGDSVLKKIMEIIDRKLAEKS